jgi:murein endopeptidase
MPTTVHSMSRTRRLALAAPIAAVVLAVAALALASVGDEPPERHERVAPAPSTVPEVRPPAIERPSPASRERIRWRRSIALGDPAGGRLVRGVRLPAEGARFFTWDPVKRRSPNRAWRRWGTDRLVRLLLQVAREYGKAHPEAPRLAIGDLSRPRGGDFGPQYGSIGHASHQNGLDIDIYYPRRDRTERAPVRPNQVDLPLSQRLVDLFVAAGAQKVFVGPSLHLRGPRRVVTPLVHHDNHIHVRLPAGP